MAYRVGSAGDELLICNVIVEGQVATESTEESGAKHSSRLIRGGCNDQPSKSAEGDFGARDGGPTCEPSQRARSYGGSHRCSEKGRHADEPNRAIGVRTLHRQC